MDSDPRHRQYLVIQTASIGDVILATAIPEKLHLTYPDAHIDFLLRKGCEHLFAGHPFIREVLIWDKGNGKYKDLKRLKRMIRARRYDAVINLQRFASSGWLTAFSKAKYKAGFRKNPWSLFFNHKADHRISLHGRLHETQRNQALLAGLAPGDPGPVRLYPRPEDFKAVESLMKEDYITIAPYSLWYTKQYPVEKWRQFLRELSGSSKVYLLGSSAERAKAEADFGGMPMVVNLAGKLSLLQTAALMKGARMNFTNDSAPLHLASAVNAPVTAIFCSTVPAFGFGPLSDNSLVLETDGKLPCRPCGLHGKKSCPEKHMKCGMDIPPEKLIKRVEDV